MPLPADNREAFARARAVLARAAAFIERHALISPGDRVAVAVSGGADSVALLHVLLQLREGLGLTLSVAHFDHRLRGDESDADARFVAELARTHGLPIESGAADVAAASREAAANLEGTARHLRYAFLKSLVERNKADRVVTGHTADDQAETVLARFLRGAGTRGLAGIYPLVDGWLARPLLEIRRDELRAVLATAGASWREDCSNRDPRFTRNRLRHHLLPVLEQYNRRLVNRLGTVSQVARDEEDYWRVRTGELFARACAAEPRDGEMVLKLDIGCFVQLLSAERRRLLRRASEFLSSRRLDAAHVEALLGLALAGQSGQQLAIPGLRVRRVFDRLEFRLAGAERPRAATESPASYRYELRVPGSCILPSGGQLVVELVDQAHPDWGYTIREEGVVDPHLVSESVIVRNWNPGDTFESAAGTRKLKQLLLGKRICVEDRKGWPVVLAGERIIWSRGFGVARAFRLRSDSSPGIWIHEVLAHA